jgi:hypothetical protein
MSEDNKKHRNTNIEQKRSRTRSGGTKRSTIERERDLVTTAEMYLKGYSFHEINEEINKNPDYNVTKTTIYNDVREIKERWLESQIQDFNTAKVKELAKIDQLERAYWEGWERSIKEQNTVEVEKADDVTTGAGASNYTRTKTKRTSKKRDGSVDFLQGVERCINLRCKILGLTVQTQFKKDWESAAREAGINEQQAQSQFDEMVQTFTKSIADGKEKTKETEE